MQNYITPNFSFAQIIPDHGVGSRVWDTEGKEYIDLAGGIAVNALGHCHPELVAALTEQANKLWHISNYYTTEPSQNLAKALVDHTFANKVFFANSGAEANEAAFKLARKYCSDNFGPHKTDIISCVNSFHGRTLFTVSVGGQPKYQHGFAPLPEGIHHTPYNDTFSLETAVNENTCAIVIELIQGESGVLPADLEFVETARRLCNEYNAVLIFDEVQTGMGRTGKLFAYEHYDVVPDVLTCAKALGGGFPVAAMLCTDKIAPALSAGSHGTTFGGNPLACAVGLAAFNLINQPSTYENIHKQSQMITAEMMKLSEELGGVFKEIRGKGLLLGCVLDEKYENKASEIVDIARDCGVMILQAGGSVIRLAPSLLLTDEERAVGLERVFTALRLFIENNAEQKA